MIRKEFCHHLLVSGSKRQSQKICFFPSGTKPIFSLFHEFINILHAAQWMISLLCDKDSPVSLMWPKQRFILIKILILEWITGKRRQKNMTKDFDCIKVYSIGNSWVVNNAALPPWKRNAVELSLELSFELLVGLTCPCWDTPLSYWNQSVETAQCRQWQLSDPLNDLGWKRS